MSSNVDETLAWFEEYGITGERNGEEFKVLCPFHSDSTPSCSVNLEKRVFRCYACDAKGDLVSFLAAKLHTTRMAVKKHLGMVEAGTDKIDDVSEDLAIAYHRALMKSKKWLLELQKRKGINVKTVERYTLGLDDNRVTMPVHDQRGKIVNIRKWSPTDKKHKVISMEGRGKAHLYPMDWQEAAEVVILEGEMKALLMCQMDFHATSPTGGAGTWSAEWNSLFAGKIVYILYDIDKAGKLGSNKVANQLFSVAKEVRVVQLPISPEEFPTGDITDYVVTLGHTAEDVRKLLDAALPWQPAPMSVDELDDKQVHELHLSQTSLGKWCGKLIRSEVVVSAKDTAPFMVPLEFSVKCPKDMEVCALCPVFNKSKGESENGSEDGPVFKIAPTDAVLLEMVDVSKSRIDTALKRAASIPKGCDVCKFKVLKTQNVEEVRLIPQLNISSNENEHVVRRAFYIGHGIETNTQYSVQARALPEPNTQYATLMLYEAKPSVDSLSAFKLDPFIMQDLKMFQPKFWDVEHMKAKLDDIYADFESNVTRIYGRQDMHLFYDLVYHSVLYIPFQEKQQKGWVEGLVLGDSGQGKSETIKYMMKHYGLGEKIDSKGATVAGLLGGLQETAKRWFVSWGIITLNDRRLVVLEEVKGMDESVIARLTDMRSSGIAEIPKIEKARANARCRLIWISNPRSDRQVLSYNYGVEAIRELVGALEDVRRFDMAMVVASGEVSKKFLNISETERPARPHVYTSAPCRNLILWAWSRKPENIRILAETEAAILKHSEAMGERYASRIPLVEAADQRIKLARLSAALAARTYSTEDAENLVVRPCHVEYVVQFLDKLYTSPACGYREFSDLILNEEKLHDEAEIAKAIANLPHAKDAVRAMLDAPGLTPFDVVDWTGVETDKARELVGLLVRKNALKRGRKNYVKTPPFIVMLKKLQMNGKLENESQYDKSKKEEF